MWCKRTLIILSSLLAALGGAGGALADKNTSTLSHIEQRISDHPDLSEAARNIEIRIEDNEIILEGMVESRAEVYDLENLIRLEAWDITIHNHLTVRPYVQRGFMQLYE
jgi:hypothetical protein